MISIKLQISLRHGCSPVNLLHTFRIPFYNKTNEGLVPTETVQLIYTDNILSAYMLVALYYGDLYWEFSLLSQIVLYVVVKHSHIFLFHYFYLFYDSKAVVQRCSVIKGVLRNFARFTGKHMCQRLFCNKVASKRGSGTGVFLWILRNF